MPYSFSRLLAETGRSIPMPVFDPPTLTPLRRPVAESTIGLFVSCGAQLPDDPPLRETEDITFRLLHRDTPLRNLTISHKTLVRKWAVEDLNVAYPIERLKELEGEGVFKRLAHTNVSMVGSIERYTELVEQTVPSIKAVFDAQGVDLVLLLPFCPACHRATAIVARALEARGLPTISTSVLWEMSAAVKPPRTSFLDFPLGCPAGKPHEPAQQRDILRRVFESAPAFDEKSWAMNVLPFQWSAGGDRGWEHTTDELYRNGGLAITARHMDAHALVGESLVGHERAFAVKCNC
jgi:D-proline reductase (dithiol) PrdB